MLIAFTGKMGSGKTTCAKYLVEKHGFVMVNFKDALVTELRERFSPLLAQFQEVYGLSTINELFFVKPPMMRTLLQQFGTEVRRRDDAQYWVKRWNDSILGKHYGKNIVVDDVRFNNEASAIKTWQGNIVRIVKPGAEQSSHSSETEMDTITPDVTIEANNGDVEALYKKLDNYIKEYV